jgi:iron complex outermembrane receptor protein
MFVRAANLLDKEARRHTSLVKDIAPLPGRNFSIGVRARF